MVRRVQRLPLSYPPLSEPTPPPRLSQADIARVLGVSQTRVYQLEKRALDKLRRGLLKDAAVREMVIEACGVEMVRDYLPKGKRSA